MKPMHTVDHVQVSHSQSEQRCCAWQRGCRQPIPVPPLGVPPDEGAGGPTLSATSAASCCSAASLCAFRAYLSPLRPTHDAAKQPGHRRDLLCSQHPQAMAGGLQVTAVRLQAH